jgi:hypothetical protein
MAESTIENNNLENRVKSFIDNVRQNVKNELIDIFDSEIDEKTGKTVKPLYMKNTVKTGGSIVNTSSIDKANMNTSEKNANGDIVMNLNDGISRRRRIKNKDLENDADGSQPIKARDIYSFRSKGSKDKITDKLMSTPAHHGEIQSDTHKCENDRALMVDFCRDNVDTNTSACNLMDKNESPVNREEALGNVIKNESTVNREEALGNVIKTYIDSILLTPIEDFEDEKDEKDEKDEIKNKCADRSNGCIIYQSGSKDLNKEYILDITMDTNDVKKIKVGRLQEMVRMNEDMKAITDLGVHDKLWVSERERKEKTSDGEVTKKYNCLEIHQAGWWPIDSVTRTWNGQGREPILAHISNMVDILEAHSEYNDLLKNKSFIPQYATKINDSANKIENVLLHQYDNYHTEIEDYVRRMKDASKKILAVHNSS